MNLESSEAFNENMNVQKSVDELDKVIVELRQIVRNLMPETLLEQGLEKSLHQFCTSMSSEKTTVSFYGSNLNEITNRFQQINIYRIVLELVTNAIRHGDATEILAQITFENAILLIDVEDNGNGFNPETAQRNLGLNSIENRVKSLNGNVKWTSNIGNGTFVNIECHL
jgi:signal transduction histidine kinase